MQEQTVMNFLALACVVLLLGTVILVVKIQPKGRQASICQHAAEKWWTYALFGTSLTVFGSLLLLFLYTSLGPTLKAPGIFYTFLAITWLCLVFTAWIPDKGDGKLHKSHQIISLALALMITLVTASLVFAQQISTLTQILAFVATIWFCYTLYLFFFIKRTHRHFLVYQMTNIIVFFIVIGSGAFLS